MVRVFSNLPFQQEFQRVNADILRQQRETLRQSEGAVLQWQETLQQAHQKVFLSTRKNATSTAHLYKNTFKNLSKTLADFVLKGKTDFRRLIDAILRDLLRLQRQRMFSTFSAQASSLIPDFLTAGIFHQGGIVAKEGTSRRIHAQLFHHAPRLHRGGVAGLRSDEVPTILQKGEGVFTPAQMQALRPANDQEALRREIPRPVNVVVNVHNAPEGTRIEQSRTSDGGLQLDVVVEQVEGRIGERLSQGDGLDPVLQQTYGIKRQGQ